MKTLWRYIDERTGAGALWNALFERHVPEAKGRVSWLYTLGSATLVVLILQVVTGCLMAMNYVPSPDHAYDSVRFMNEQVLFGHWIRGIHHWGASFLVILVFLHLLRVLFMGAYKYPREATWWVGVLLFLLVMGFGFTGYLLPWDQKAYWATTVGTNISAQTPFIGRAMSVLLKGGNDLGAATLTRFYTLHVLVLPIFTAFLVIVHVFLVVWHGISAPPEREKSEPLSEEPKP